MNGKRVMRITGTLLLAAGVAMLVWVLVVWRWQDPFTALYTTWKQHQLSQSYSDVPAVKTARVLLSTLQL